MSIDRDTFEEMFNSLEPAASEENEFDDEPPVRENDEFEEPPVRANDEFDEPPVRADEPPPIQVEIPPPTQEELEAAAAEELLKIAAQEERDIKKVRKTMRTKSTATFIVTCPKGCRIRVKESHRGRAGKCPRCQSEFVVPLEGNGE